jgi:hypothetical protein
VIEDLPASCNTVVEIKPTSSNFIDASIDAYILDNKIVGSIGKVCDGELHVHDKILLSMERKVYSVNAN